MVKGWRQGYMIQGWKVHEVEDHVGVDGWSGINFESMGVSVGCVGYSCISGSPSFALGCVGTYRAKTSGFDLYSEVMYFYLCGTVHMEHCG